MKITRANVAKYAETNGLEPKQVDGIPEGFLFLEPDITIGDETHRGNWVLFFPLKPWDEGKLIIDRGTTTTQLLAIYKHLTRDGK